MEKVDYIIVSGICEATEMASRLDEHGVSKQLIYKELESKSTFQNYCYSRKLKDEEGNLLIKPGDSLYVVSNHWHAIPVVARFRRYNNVNAQYYIVGEITPDSTDNVNYGNIYSDKTYPPH